MKTKKYLPLTFLLLTLVAACGGTDLVDQFTANQAAESGAVEVQAIHHLHDGSAGELSTEATKTFTNDLGYEITLSAAQIHFHQIRLISSGFDPECLGGQDQEVMLHASFDLMGEDLLTHHLATASVPRAAFCEFELQVGSAAHAMIKLAHDDEGETETHGESSAAFHVSGSWSKDGDMGDFAFVGMEPSELHYTFMAKEDGVVVDHALHFHEGEGLISVLIGTKYDVLFNGIDFQDHGVALEQIYENLHEAVHQHTSDHHGSAPANPEGGHDHP